MDLSICLPLYQQKPHSAVKELITQAEKLNADYEILIIDDASAREISEVNTEFFSQFPQVRYLVLKNNIGRAKMRNRIAAEAKGNFMLCLDSDLQINSDTFLEIYWKKRLEAQVLVGGRETSSPIKACELRYLYAKKREEKSLSERQVMPYASFMTGNFFCEKIIFEQIEFDESLHGYGHEDTLFGFDLESLKISILQLNNPVVFDADDTNRAFLEKTKEALENLRIVKLKHPELSKKIKLVKLYLLLKNSKTTSLFRLCYWPFQKMILKNLLSSKPRLLYFDLFKLNHFIKS